MRLAMCSSVLVLVAACGAGWGQAAPTVDAADVSHDSGGLTLLRQVAQKYADAKSYSIEVSEVEKFTGEYQESTQKTLLTAAEAPGGKYHFEGHGATGSAMKVADGSKVWSYRIESHQYKVSSEAEGAQPGQTMFALSEMAQSRAEGLRSELARMAERLKSAERLGDVTISFKGKPVLCEAVRVKSSDLQRSPVGYTFDKTIYIDKTRQVMLEVINHIRYDGTQTGMASDQTVTTNYTVTELDGRVREGLFTFAAPADAQLVADFPDPQKGFGMPNLTGQAVPALRLRSKDGKVVPIESFRGKPVVIDFWATWCAPCVASFPQLAEIEKDGKDKGLVVIGVDRDEDAGKAADLMAKKGYGWMDFHDGDSEIERLVGASPIPRVMLIDAKGQVVFDANAPVDDRLRAAIAKLGPEFAAMAPKPSASPCVASK